MASSNPSSSAPTPSDTPEASRESLARHLHPADLRGAAQLATEATLEGTRLVEAVHAAVLALLRGDATEARPQAAGLTGWVYRTVRRIAHVSGWVGTRVLEESEQVLEPGPPPDSRARQRLLSVLNGVLGDHLVASGSPLARSFSMRSPDGTRVDLDARGPAAPDTLVVFVHGLCQSDRAWMSAADDRSGPVEALAAPVDGVPILARYNSGRPIRVNGRALAEHLDSLTAPPDGASRLVLVAHSMGGLVARSAARHARRASAGWPDRVTETIYLGTPHRGAPLERAGAWVEDQLRRTPLTAPLATLATLRSQGIQDLRHGTISPEEAATHPANRSEAAACSSGRVLYGAGTLASGRTTRDVIGDGLVPVSSALASSGASDGATRRLFEGLGHLELVRDPAVAEYLCGWLSEDGPAPAPGPES
jgi:pimeloyl-ACP methyl ester carboxylesterase